MQRAHHALLCEDRAGEDRSRLQRPGHEGDAPFDSSAKGLAIRLVGFGVTGGGDEAAPRKRWGATTIASFGDDDFRFLPTPSQTCNGDSGGPALAQVGGEEVVVGLASSGDSSCASYGRHVRIDANLAFVESYAVAYARHRTLAPMANSGCSMKTHAPISTSSTTALVLALGCAAALRARRLRRGAGLRPCRATGCSGGFAG